MNPYNSYILFNNATISISGSQIVSGSESNIGSFDSKEIILIINILNVPTGVGPSIIFTIQDVDPVNQSTVVGDSISSSSITSITSTSIKIVNSVSDTIKISWVVSGSGAQFSGVNATVIQKVSGGIETKLNTLGQKTMIGSAPVVIASDQIITTKFGDTTNLDAFGRLRISGPETLFDSKQLVDKQPLFWDDQQTAGSGTTSTYLTNQAATQMSVSNVTAGTRVRQTFERQNYQPGKGMSVIMTGVLGSGATGITRRIGYFDQNNGCFFQLSGTTLSVVVRSFVTGSAVDTLITQADWNLDKLDGTGASGVTIDISKAQIFVIDFQWLGVGRVRFGVDIGGILIYVHQILNANVLSTVWMSSPNLPCRYEISNSGVGPAANLIHICSSVISEGGREKTGFVLSIDRGDTVLTTLNNNSVYPLIAIRLKSTYLMASIEELSLSVLSLSNSAYRYCLVLNPTVTGTAFSFTGITNSAVEADVTTTSATTISGGNQILSGYIDATAAQGNLIQDIPSDLRLGSSIAGVSDIMVLGVQRITGTAESFYASLCWRENI